MEFNIRHIKPYKELHLKGDSFTTETGFMDAKECVSLAISLLEAANDLLLDTQYEIQCDHIACVLEALE